MGHGAWGDNFELRISNFKKNRTVADWWNRPVRPYSTLQILVLRTRFARRK
jgi:hypothetical protein